MVGRFGHRRYNSEVKKWKFQGRKVGRYIEYRDAYTNKILHMENLDVPMDYLLQEY